MAHTSCNKKARNNEIAQLKDKKYTFSDNALDADHGADELREKFSWSDAARDKRSFKAY